MRILTNITVWVAFMTTLARGETATKLPRPFAVQSFQSQALPTDALMASILSLRGGAKKKSTKTASKPSRTVTGKKKVGDNLAEGKKKDSADDLVKDIFSKIKPLTKIYLGMIAFCTVLGYLLGDERAQALMVLDPMRTIYGGEIWRPITAAAYFGKLSINTLMSLFYLVQYGNQLEGAYGPAQFLVFLMSQVFTLSILSMLFRQPIYGTAVVTAMLHILSRLTPKQNMRWLVVDIPYVMLPYAFMLADVLQAQSLAAAVPHVLGIMSGHFYLFHKLLWPKMGGEDWLKAPDFWIERMDPNAVKKSAAKESLSKALKSRKRGQGKKLGQ